ncbi:hypothetical protein U1701_09680 [Sphingomonas sp. PB2P19]|uniref:hypothetical protein n=1 Tax=Sphingomonas rhamnosi TaxID=3096156 RepID=UPI002FC7BCF0
MASVRIGGRSQVKRCEHGEIGRAVFEHMIEVPDLEMIAHADQQRPLGDTTPPAHPRGDRDAAAPVELGRRHEPEGTAAGGFARSSVVVIALSLAVAVVSGGNTRAIIDNHALRFVMQTDEEMVVRRARLDGDAERVVQRHVTTNTNARQCTADEEIVHICPSTESEDEEPAGFPVNAYPVTIVGWLRLALTEIVTAGD